jgi:uncharacterized membrane-anchored protein YhcB (DUF1043 family)
MSNKIKTELGNFSKSLVKHHIARIDLSKTFDNQSSYFDLNIGINDASAHLDPRMKNRNNRSKSIRWANDYIIEGSSVVNTVIGSKISF